MAEREYWLAFSVCSGVGPKKFALLLEKFDSAENSWNAPDNKLVDVLGPVLGNKVINFRKEFSFEKYISLLNKKDVWFVTLLDAEYPARLREIPNPPFLLFGKGSKEILNQIQDDPSTSSGQANMIGVVGTRKITEYGRQVTGMITLDLVSVGCTIVSGLAMGVDALAHKTTLEHKGMTIAVLGCGVDCCTPRENELIYQKILENNGAIISEFPLSMMPSKGSFPSRNRIIAGMSEAVLVTEGAEDSGSLITAGNALDFGRKVFAVPGPITSSLSNGPMRLIRKGAVLITSGEDILKELGVKEDVREGGGKGKKITGDTKDEQRIIDLLQNESLSFDELIKLVSIPSSQLGTILSLMEVKGMTRSETGGKITLNN